MTTNATAQAAASDIRDIKPPVAILNGWELVWWALAAMVLFSLVTAIVLFCLLRKKQRPMPPVLPAHVRAKQKLAEALALITQPKPFVIAVSDTARAYLEERFKFHAPERTTEEFLHELRGTDLLLPDQKESVGHFLGSCDLVKFAKYEPGESELRGLHSSALRLVEETEPVEIKVECEKWTTVETETPHFSEKFTALPTGISNVNPFPKARIFAIAGTLLQLAPIVWVVGYFVSIYRLYNLATDAPTIAMSHGMQALPEILSKELAIMKNELWLILISILIGLAGLVLLLISLVPLRYRAEWFFWFLMIYGLMLFGTFPFGTIFGIFFLVYCLTKRHEFLKR